MMIGRCGLRASVSSAELQMGAAVYAVIRPLRTMRTPSDPTGSAVEAVIAPPTGCYCDVCFLRSSTCAAVTVEGVDPNRAVT